VSDRDKLFTSLFWKTLAQSLGINRDMSTSFHPQTDGQTERMNHLLEQYLRLYCNYQQNDWADLLSLAEFAYSNASQESIQTSPIFANYGYHPRFNPDVHGRTTPSVSVSSEEHAKCLREIHDHLVEAVKRSQNDQAKLRREAQGC
jgi:hypothetical protein